MISTSGNFLTLVALFGSPLAAAVLFSTLRIPLAFLVMVVGGYLLLPEQTALDLPGVPALDKTTLPVLCAFAFATIRVAKTRGAGSDSLGSWRPNDLSLWFLLIGVGGLAMTALTNSDPIHIGNTVLPAIRPYDGGSMILGFLFATLPLLAARRLLAAPQNQRLLLLVICISGLAYSLPALFEVRMSPQLSNWIYGFFPHSFAQHFRGGGFRPVVFLNHGLWLAVFFAGSVLAAAACFRFSAPERRWRYVLATIWLFVTLLACKSLGSLLIAVVLLPIVLAFSLRISLLAAAAIAGIMIAYPAARGLDLVPTERVTSAIAAFAPERASSLQTRLDNEDILLERAAERRLFGWGGWGRSRVYNAEGRDITIADGAWIIFFGVGGWVYYIAIYGLLGAPIILLALRAKELNVGFETAGIAIILTANLVDMIPNGTLTPITWLLAGALWGRLAWQESEAPEAAPATSKRRQAMPRGRDPAVARGQDRPAYTRQQTRIERRPGPAS